MATRGYNIPWNPGGLIRILDPHNGFGNNPYTLRILIMLVNVKRAESNFGILIFQSNFGTVQLSKSVGVLGVVLGRRPRGWTTQLFKDCSTKHIGQSLTHLFFFADFSTRQFEVLNSTFLAGRKTLPARISQPMNSLPWMVDQTDFWSPIHCPHTLG